MARAPATTAVAKEIRRRTIEDIDENDFSFADTHEIHLNFPSYGVIKREMKEDEKMKKRRNKKKEEEKEEKEEEEKEEETPFFSSCPSRWRNRPTHDTSKRFDDGGRLRPSSETKILVLVLEIDRNKRM